MFLFYLFAGKVLASVIGIDYGSELIKVALIRPTQRLVIVENEQSKRSTPSAVSFTEQGRQFGSNALKEYSKRPESTLLYSHNLLSSVPESYFNRTFQSLSFIQNNERNSTMVSFKGQNFEYEELTAMILENIKEMTCKFAEHNITDTAVTVPAFWTRGQRVALINSALAAGLNVLGLIHENTAAALYYGLDRWDNVSDHFVIFFNLGSSYLQVSLAKYSVTYKKNIEKLVEHVQILAHSTDSQLGGGLFDSFIALKVAEKFREAHKIDLTGMTKIMARILTQANQAKKTLSANKSTQVVLSSLINGVDFFYTVSREEFEEMIEGTLNRLRETIVKVCLKAEVDLQNVSSIEVIGGNSRIPRVQEKLKQFTGFNVSSHLNGDESSALGAALFAANLSSVIAVRPVLLTDVATHAYYARIVSEDEGWKKELPIFNEGDVLGSHKKITFETLHDFDVFIGEQVEETVNSICVYVVRGLSELKSSKVQVFLNFVLDVSGIPYLYSADAQAEPQELDEGKLKDQGTKNTQLDIKSDTERLLSDFNRMNDSCQDCQNQMNSSELNSSGLNQHQSSVHEALNDSSSSQEKNTQNSSEHRDTLNVSSSENIENSPDSSNSSSNTSKASSKTPKKPKLKHISLKFQQVELETPKMLSPSEVSAIITSLAEQKLSEIRADQLQIAKNDLESFIYFASEKAEEEVFFTFASSETRSEVLDLIASLRLWMETEDFQIASIEKVQAQKALIESKVFQVLEKENEEKVRPDVVDQSRKKIMKIAEDLKIIRENRQDLKEEVEEANQNLNQLEAWLEQKVIDQKSRSLDQPLVLVTKDLKEKVDQVFIQVETLKKKPQKKNEEKSGNFEKQGKNREENSEKQGENNAKNKENPENQDQSSKGDL